jgi:hypothetical protein
MRSGAVAPHLPDVGEATGAGNNPLGDLNTHSQDVLAPAEVGWKEDAGGCHDQAEVEWIVIRRPLRVITIRPWGGQHPTNARSVGCPGLSTLRAYLMFSVTFVM